MIRRRLFAVAVWVAICAAVAGVLVGDAFGLVLVACLAPVGIVCLWYISDPAAPPGYSERLHAWVRARWWHAALFVGVMVAFILHILTGWPSQFGGR